MRVLVITPLYVPWIGGLEHFVRQVVLELAGRGHDVTVVTSHQSSTTERDTVDGVPVLRVPAHHVALTHDAGGVLRVQMDIARLINEFDPEVVHSHDAGPVLWLYTRAARRRPRPLVVTLHNVMRMHFDGDIGLLGKLLRMADAVTAVSQAVADDTVGFEPSIADRTTVIRNAITPRRSSPAPLLADPLTLVCVGRLVVQKGFDLAIEAVARL
ncbi:MAG TPA: glycosyltransferase family 4 protein, partial [Ilumatobacteraceae bacterium]|nr:glycosyltransferase family 4 protein [Ilumatobacteraceae bacterium]